MKEKKKKVHYLSLFQGIYEYNLGSVWIKGEGGRMKRGRVELAENRLISNPFYSTLSPSPSIQTDYRLGKIRPKLINATQSELDP